MYQPTCQRFQRSNAAPKGHGCAVRLPRLSWRLLALTLVVALTGCATEGQVTDASTALGNLFQRPTEAGFRAMAEANCGSLSIGDTAVDALLGNNTAFDTLVTALYDGDISNDEFMNQVLLEYPAPDANVPATGCIMDQLDRCFAETCKVTTAQEREKLDQANAASAEEITNTVTLDPTELPAEDAQTVERMIEQSKDDGPKPLP